MRSAMLELARATAPHEIDQEAEASAPAFADLLPPLRAAIERRGFTELTSVQQAVVAAAAEGQNLRISSQTGSGKTVALGIAIAGDLTEAAAAKTKNRKGPRALVVCPTRELAQQFARELRWLYEDVKGLQVAVVTGGTDIGAERRVLSKKPLVLVGTPGRTLDHVRAGALDFADLRHVVLDEADQMLDMGFKDELDAIVEALPPERHSYLVSATFPPEVRRFADRFAPDAIALEGTRLGAANEDIEHVVYVVAQHERYAALVNNLLMMHGARVLVFVTRRTDSAELAERLSGDGFGALPMSGDLSQAQRNRTLAAFRRGVVQILVATDVAARGIDVADIAMVVHGDVPRDAQSYTHRSGRTGRAGQSGRSILLATPKAERHVRRLLQSAGIKAQFSGVPSAKAIRKSVTKRARRGVHDAMVEPKSDEGSRKYAADLLEKYDPAVLVAELLRLAEGELPREPMDVSASKSTMAGPAGQRDEDRSRSAERSAGPAKRRDQVYEPFKITWGQSAGATPARLLAHICRRGGIDRHSVGAMQVYAQDSRFEIAKSAAQAFAEATAEPDPRDPKMIITRTTGPVRTGGPRPRKPRGDDESRNFGGPGERKPKRKPGNFSKPRRDPTRRKK